MIDGKGYVEMTSIDAETSQDIATSIIQKGGRYLEAQVRSLILHSKVLHIVHIFKSFILGFFDLSKLDSRFKKSSWGRYINYFGRGRANAFWRMSNLLWSNGEKFFLSGRCRERFKNESYSTNVGRCFYCSCCRGIIFGFVFEH